MNQSALCCCRLLSACLLLAAVCVSRASADEVLLRSGKTVKGTIEGRPGGVAVVRGKKTVEVSWREVDWLVIRTKRFRFLSRVAPEKTRQYAAAFEGFVDALAKTFKFKPKFRKNWTVQIRIFRNEKEYAKYEAGPDEVSKGKAQSLGFFRINYEKSIEEVVVFDDPHDPGETFDTLLHEGLHLMLHIWGKAKNFGFPRWIDEGMAEYFGGSYYEPARRRKKATFSQGLQKPWRLGELRKQLSAKKTPSLRELLLLGSEFDGSHYAPSWALIHFFAHAENGRYAKRLNRFCQDLRRTVREGERTISLFEKVMKVKLPVLEKKWRAYVDAMRPETLEDAIAQLRGYDYSGDGKLMLTAVKPVLRAHPNHADARAFEALGYWHSEKYKKAKKSVEQAIALDPASPVALRARALISYYVDAWDDALDAFDKYRAAAPYDLSTGIVDLRCLISAPKGKADPQKAQRVGEALAAYHHDVGLLTVMGDVYVKLGKPTEAKKRYEAALALDLTAKAPRKKLDALEKALKSSKSP